MCVVLLASVALCTLGVPIATAAAADDDCASYMSERTAVESVGFGSSVALSLFS